MVKVPILFLCFSFWLSMMEHIALFISVMMNWNTDRGKASARPFGCCPLVCLLLGEAPTVEAAAESDSPPSWGPPCTSSIQISLLAARVTFTSLNGLREAFVRVLRLHLLLEHVAVSLVHIETQPHAFRQGLTQQSPIPPHNMR